VNSLHLLPRLYPESDPPASRLPRLYSDLPVSRVPDITVIREEDQVVMRRERLLAAAERIAKMGSWELDLATGRMRWSDQLYELFGVPNDGEEPPLDVALAYIHRKDVARVRAVMKTALAEGRSCSCDARIVRPGGEIRHVTTHLEVVKEHGMVVRLIGVTQDITERVKVVQEREEALGKLEDANKALAEFAYVVSHDLKAPLRGIGSLADWIANDQRERLDDEGKEQIDLLRDRVKRMNEMIEGILRYSRVGRSQVERSMLDLGELVHETVDLLAPPAHIAVRLEGEFPRLRGARTQIGQVFQNLIGNAIKFCDKPEGSVVVRATPRETDVLFEVVDNGPGIEERHFGRIFQLFQTLSAKRADSTGIGLSIVKKIVESEGGRIWLESKVGEGSRFCFTLPRNGEAT
jgi:PAS domain S-box-containing protein